METLKFELLTASQKQQQQQHLIRPQFAGTLVCTRCRVSFCIFTQISVAIAPVVFSPPLRGSSEAGLTLLCFNEFAAATVAKETRRCASQLCVPPVRYGKTHVFCSVFKQLFARAFRVSLNRRKQEELFSTFSTFPTRKTTASRCFHCRGKPI